MQLPLIVTSCTDQPCGACCREQCSPPMYLLCLLQIDGGMTPEHEDWYDDHDRVAALPPEAVASLREYHQRLMRDKLPDGLPCIWYEASTQSCRHYEHRPDICRNGLDVGSPGCIAWRRRYGIGSVDEVPTEQAMLGLGELPACVLEDAGLA